MQDNKSNCVLCSKELIDGLTTRWNKHSEPVCDNCYKASEEE
jgi:hypothetical protein